MNPYELFYTSDKSGEGKKGFCSYLFFVQSEQQWHTTAPLQSVWKKSKFPSFSKAQRLSGTIPVSKFHPKSKYCKLVVPIFGMEPCKLLKLTSKVSIVTKREIAG